MAKEYKYCPKCNAKVWGRPAVCPMCDEDITRVKAHVIEDDCVRVRECPSCKATVYSKTNECPMCNADLAGARVIEDGKKKIARSKCVKCGATIYGPGACPFCDG